MDLAPREALHAWGCGVCVCWGGGGGGGRRAQAFSWNAEEALAGRAARHGIARATGCEWGKPVLVGTRRGNGGAIGPWSRSNIAPRKARRGLRKLMLRMLTLPSGIPTLT